MEKIVKFDSTQVISYYYDFSIYSKVKYFYELIKDIKYVPKMLFDNKKIIVPYCGNTLNMLELKASDKNIIKLQIIEAIKLFYSVKIAHRDLHTKNICWDGQIWIIDWDIMCFHAPSSIIEHYDLTGKGLPSPYFSDNMNIFKNNNIFSISKWLQPVDLTIKEFK